MSRLLKAIPALAALAALAMTASPASATFNLVFTFNGTVPPGGSPPFPTSPVVVLNTAGTGNFVGTTGDIIPSSQRAFVINYDITIDPLTRVPTLNSLNIVYTTAIAEVSPTLAFNLTATEDAVNLAPLGFVPGEALTIIASETVTSNPGAGQFDPFASLTNTGVGGAPALVVIDPPIVVFNGGVQNVIGASPFNYGANNPRILTVSGDYQLQHQANVTSLAASFIVGRAVPVPPTAVMAGLGALGLPLMGLVGRIRRSRAAA